MRVRTFRPPADSIPGPGCELEVPDEDDAPVDDLVAPVGGLAVGETPVEGIVRDSWDVLDVWVAANLELLYPWPFSGPGRGARRGLRGRSGNGSGDDSLDRANDGTRAIGHQHLGGRDGRGDGGNHGEDRLGSQPDAGSIA